jgi:hypothetical protein
MNATQPMHANNFAAAFAYLPNLIFLGEGDVLGDEAVDTTWGLGGTGEKDLFTLPTSQGSILAKRSAM